jgi:hypothetical protein
MSSAFIFSILGGIFNAANDIVYSRFSNRNRNCILSFYFITSLFSVAFAAYIIIVL